MSFSNIIFQSSQKRALRLQQQKQKEAMQHEEDHERELERERQLIAKPAKAKK